MKKKILYIITQSEFGGAQRYLLELINHLNPEKYDITVAAGPGGDFLDRIKEYGLKSSYTQSKGEKYEKQNSRPEPDEGVVQGHIKAQNLNIWRLKHLSRSINPFKDIRAYFELKTLINTIKPDILQLHSTKAGILGSIALKSTKNKVNCQLSTVKCIYRIGGWAFVEDIPNWKKKLYIFFEKYTAKYKDIIINNCEAQRQLAIKLGIAPENKIITIYNGLDLAKLTFLPQEQARQKLLTSQPIIIGTVANFYKNKGLEYLVRAVAKLPTVINYQLSIIGDGIERQNLEKLIQELKLEDKVKLHGKIPNAWQYLKAFDIFILPSIKEGQPWSILEAMAAKVPIIATNIAAIPEMVKDNQSGLLVSPKNPEAIAEKIKYLIDNPKITENLTITAYQTLQKKFTTQKMVEQTEKLYN